MSVPEGNHLSVGRVTGPRNASGAGAQATVDMANVQLHTRLVLGVDEPVGRGAARYTGR